MKNTTLNLHLLPAFRLNEEYFYSQYQYRGVYIGNYIVQKEFQSTDSINYKSTSERRKQTFQKMFTDLRAEGHINANDDDIDFWCHLLPCLADFGFLKQRSLIKVQM